MKYFILYILAIMLPININSYDLDNIQDQLPPEIRHNDISIKDELLLFKEKCKKLSGNDKAYEEIEKGADKLRTCINDLINTTALEIEIDKARPIGELDTVFNKYCNKKPIALTCISNFKDKLHPCLEDDEQLYSHVILRITTSLLNFICDKGGNHIALFIAEGGPECIESKKTNITNCLNTTLAEYIPKNLTLPKFVFGKKQCDQIDNIEQCLVTALQDCDDITPANIAESMFKFIKNETMCLNKSEISKLKMSGGSTNIISSSSFLIIFLSILFYFL